MDEHKNITGRCYLDGIHLAKEDDFNEINSEVMSLLKRIKDYGLTISTISMEVRFVDKNAEGYTEDVDKPVLHAETNDLDKVLDFVDVTDIRRRKLLRLLESYVYNNMSHLEWIKFTDTFMQLYIKLYDGGDIDDGFDPTDRHDINSLLEKHMISYMIRSVGSSYQVTPYHRRIPRLFLLT